MSTSAQRKLPERVAQAECRAAVREAYRRFNAAAAAADPDRKVTLRDARVLAALVERTAGWTRVEDKFSHDVLADLAGLSIRSVSRSLKALAAADVIAYVPGHGWGLSTARLPDVTGLHVGESPGEGVSGQHAGESPVAGEDDETPRSSPGGVDNMLSRGSGLHVGDTNDQDNDQDQRSGPLEKPSVPLMPPDSEQRESDGEGNPGFEDEDGLTPLAATIERWRAMAEARPDVNGDDPA